MEWSIKYLSDEIQAWEHILMFQQNIILSSTIDKLESNLLINLMQISKNDIKLTINDF